MIFARFHHIYTHRFESAYGDETTLNQAKREWAITLSGTSTHLVEYAMERCKREHAWPPTIAEFLKLLQPTPESLGLPSPEAAYAEACLHSHEASNHTWSHICVQLAARSVGGFKLRSEAEKLTRPAFLSAYQQLIVKLVEGESFEIEAIPPLSQPDFRAEEQFVALLKSNGISDTLAQELAYFLEKPLGSPVRHRYRQTSVQKLRAMKMDIKIPE